ncbi:MAG: O-antigen ligase family protein [Elusimicrobiota bacterium]|nr:MAG: O-antigen ligase family protein [Elusimicrobiota bacterium]
MTNGGKAAAQWHRAVPVGGLLFATMFFSTWGSGMQKLSPVDLSKIFPLLAAIVIAYAALFARKKAVFPRAFNWFAAFYVLHMVLTYTVFFPEELQFGFTGSSTRGADFVVRSEGAGIACSRIALFMAFGYAFAALLWEPRRLRLAALGYGAGLLAVLALGGYVSTEVTRASAEVRNAGGFLDPNSFGFSGLTAIVLAMLAWTEAGRDARLKAALCGAAAVGGLAVLQSGSRASMMGCLFALVTFMVLTDKLSRKVNILVAGALVGIVAFAFMPGAMLESLKERASIGRIRADRGANRLDIWSNYLAEAPSYIVAGAGVLRAKEVIRGSYTAEFAITHNQYLELLVETGLAGFALFMLALARLWRAARAAAGPANRLLSPVLLAGLVALFTEFMFLNCFYSRDTWILFGAVAGLAHHRRFHG